MVHQYSIVGYYDLDEIQATMTMRNFTIFILLALSVNTLAVIICSFIGFKAPLWAWFIFGFIIATPLMRAADMIEDKYFNKDDN